MVESAPDGMLLADQHGVILVANSELESMFGFEQGTLAGRQIDDLLPDRDRAAHADHRNRYHAHPAVRPMGAGLALRARRRDGTEFPVEISLSPLTDESGTTVIAAVRNISERVAVEAQTHLIRMTIDATHDGVFLIDPTTRRFVYVNQGAVEQTGYPRHELLHMAPLDIASAFDTQSLERLVQPLLSGEQSRVSLTTTWRHKNGHDTPVEILIGYPAATHPSADRVLVALVRDITDRRAAEAERDRQQTWMRGLSEIRSHLLQGGHFEDAVDLMASFARNLIGAEISAVGTLGDDGETVVLNRLRNGSDPGEATTHHPIDPALRSILQTEQPAVLNGGLPFANDGSDGPGFGPTMLMPLHNNLEPQGRLLLLARNRNSPPFHDTDVQLVESFTQQANTAMQLAQAQRDQQRLSILEDRARIGRDLHDLVTQHILVAGMGLSALLPRIAAPEIADAINIVIDELDRAINELRSTISGISTIDTSKSGAEHIHDAVAAYAAVLGFAPDLTMAGDADAIPFVVLEQLLPTINEALSNVVRHACATNVAVTVRLDQTTLTLDISDNGTGFDEHLVRGRGLDNLATRAARVGGTCRFINQDNGGATIIWCCPL